MPSARRGEVWLVDLGMTAKVRPALVVSIPAEDRDRALLTLVPHTTSLRQSRFEAAVPASFLRAGVFDAQNLITIPTQSWFACWVRSARRSSPLWSAPSVSGSASHSQYLLAQVVAD